MIILNVFHSSYCKTAFVLVVGAMLALLPKTLFQGITGALAIVYVIVFSVNITCLIRQTKDKVKTAPKNSAVSFIAAVIGITALNACGVGAPMCGATLGVGLFSTITPHFFLPLLSQYSVWFLIVAILLQCYSLWSMKCFRLNSSELTKH